jgi:hypothetical protein
MTNDDPNELALFVPTYLSFQNTQNQHHSLKEIVQVEQRVDGSTDDVAVSKFLDCFHGSIKLGQLKVKALVLWNVFRPHTGYSVGASYCIC